MASHSQLTFDKQKHKETLIKFSCVQGVIIGTKIISDFFHFYHIQSHSFITQQRFLLCTVFMQVKTVTQILKGLILFHGFLTSCCVLFSGIIHIWMRIFVQRVASKRRLKLQFHEMPWFKSKRWSSKVKSSSQTVHTSVLKNHPSL